MSKSNDLAINEQVLNNYIRDFQFDWDNETFDNKKEFASETIAKTKRILADIKSGNHYKKVFSAELAYSRLDGDDYSYKIVIKEMIAKNVSKAINEKDEIRAQAPKRHSDDQSYAIEDVRVKVKVIDKNENTVLEEKFLINLLID